MSGVFQEGHKPDPERNAHEWPGDTDKLDYKPKDTELPDGEYKAAGKLKGKRALITGGDSGIGRAVAIMYAMEGASSTLNYLEEEQKNAEDTKKEVEKHGVKCYLIPGDIQSAETCRKIVDFAKEKMGGIDILVNNAGYQMEQQKIEDISDEQWDRTFKVNIYSQFWITKHAVQYMGKGSAIINNTSINAYIGRPDLLDYTSTKGAILSFTRGCANMFVERGIRVNCVAPGPVHTPLVATTFSKENQGGVNSGPMKRPAQPSEIATAFVYLASSDSSYVTGQCIHVNGGMFTSS